MRHVLAVGIVVLCSVAVRADAQQSTVDDASGHATAAQPNTGEPSELIIHPIRNTQPKQIAAALRNLLQGDPRIKAIELSESGVLLVRVNADAREEVVRVLEVFDRAPRVVDVQLLVLNAGEDAEGFPRAKVLSGPIDKIMETIEQLEANKRIVVADRFGAPTLEHQKVVLLRGDRTPFVKGVRGRATGQPEYTTGLCETGMTVDITTHVTEGGRVFVDLEVDTTEIAGDVPFALGTIDVKAPVIRDMTIQTTLQLDDGHAEALGAAFHDGYNSPWPVVLVIAVRIRGEGEPSKEFSSPAPVGVDASRLSSHLHREPEPGENYSLYLKYATKFIEKYDQDKGQSLDREEWSKTPLSNSTTFANVDANGDGGISAEELAKVLATR